MRSETHKITRIVPPVWLMLAMIAMWLLNAFIPLGYVFAPAAQPLGMVLIFSGFSLVFLTARMFKAAKTPLKPFVPARAVIRTGPFRYSRNPVYLGMFVLLGGWAVYLGALSPWLVVVWFIHIIRKHWVLKEEIQMERQMGEEYLHYKDEVRRWL